MAGDAHKDDDDDDDDKVKQSHVSIFMSISIVSLISGSGSITSSFTSGVFM